MLAVSHRLKDGVGERHLEVRVHHNVFVGQFRLFLLFLRIAAGASLASLASPTARATTTTTSSSGGGGGGLVITSNYVRVDARVLARVGTRRQAGNEVKQETPPR